MNDNLSPRKHGWGLPLLVSLGLWAAILLVGHAALAQTPNPVTPGYQVCNTSNPGNTRCSFQPVDSTHGLPVALPGGGSAVTVADGADVTEGAKADAAFSGSGSGSVISVLKGIFNSVNLAASGGVTTFFVQPTASDNHTNIKNGAGQVYWILAENNSATVNYLRFYNSATGFNGCNSATGLVTQIQIPANTAVGGINIALPFGIPFSNGISVCVTSGYSLTDTTNATATAMSLTIGYF